MKSLLMVGVILIFLGMFLIFFSVVKLTKGTEIKEKNSKTKIAVGGLIGPIPFGFGNDKDWTKFVVLIGMAFLVFWIIFNLIWFKK